jgi:hypothetical protein
VDAVSRSDLFEEPVHLWTGLELGDLRFQLGFLGCDVFFKCVRGGSATLHDTTSGLPVLTVGLRALPILICRGPAVGSEVNIQIGPLQKSN